MAAISIISRIARTAGAVAEWILRIVVAFIALAVLVACSFAAFSQPWAMIGLPVSAYFLFGMLVPEHLSKALRWIGGLLSGPYNRYFVPYVAEPIEAGAKRAFPFIGQAMLGVLGIAVALVGLALAALLGVAAFKGIAALPVSVAVVVGAIIIAGALASNR